MGTRLGKGLGRWSEYQIALCSEAYSRKVFRLTSGIRGRGVKARKGVPVQGETVPGTGSLIDVSHSDTHHATHLCH